MPTENNHPNCPQHVTVADLLEKLDGKVDTILDKLNAGAVNFAVLDASIKALAGRVDMLEKCMYGGIGFVLIVVIGAVVALVIKS